MAGKIRDGKLVNLLVQVIGLLSHGGHQGHLLCRRVGPPSFVSTSI